MLDFIHLPVIRLVLIGLLLSPPSSAATPVILVLGDSLSAAYGMPLDKGWVSLLQTRLDDKGYQYRVVNASISGDTTLQGINRLPAALGEHKPAIVILELGGNDGLRGQSLDTIERNLAEMIQSCQNNGARPLLAGMLMPPNYGSYATRFNNIYPDLSERFAIPLIPFFMAGVANSPKYLQPDDIHPNAEAQIVLLDNVWEHLLPLL